MKDRTYLFEYWFEGDHYGLTVVASSVEEAGRKVRRMSSAEYKGEVAAIIPASPRSIWSWLRGKFAFTTPQSERPGQGIHNAGCGVGRGATRGGKHHQNRRECLLPYLSAGLGARSVQISRTRWVCRAQSSIRSNISLPSWR